MTLNLYATWTAAAVTIPPMRTSTRHATARTVKPLASVAPPAGQTWVLGSLRLINPTTKALATKVATKYGVWTLSTRLATVTFVPTRTFSGTARIAFRVGSSGGLVATSTITIVVLPARVLVRSATVYFAPMSAALSPRAKATLRALAASVLKLGRPTSSVTTGYVQATTSSANDRSLSAARARNVAAYLTKLGLPHATSARGLGRAYDKGWKARRATATITFTIG
jgi:outer membrane protein OmpA-like peptidoglycan-associated protein